MEQIRKSELNKRKKRYAIRESAYHLFTTVGFNNTTTHAIAEMAGIGTGTLYLYYDSKEQLRDELIMIRSGQVLNSAVNEMREYVKTSSGRVSVSDRIIFTVDYILDVVSADHALLNFIAKNLSWGLLFRPDEYKDEDIIDVRALVMNNFRKDGIELRDPALLFFTIIELVSSTCYSTILHEDPVTLDEYRPYLHNTIRMLVEDAVIKDVE